MQPEPRDFAALYEQYRPRLLLVCRRMLPNHPHEAEPIAQEAFLRAWAALDRFADDRSFWPWLSTIAAHLCTDYLRTTGRDEGIRRRTEHRRTIALPVPEEAVEQAEDRRLARCALESLNDRHRRLVHLRHVEGWSYEQIAAFEQVSVDSVRGALKRARERMRAAYTAMVDGWAAVPGLAWARRTTERFSQWVVRLGDVPPPKVTAGAIVVNVLAALLVGASLQGTPPSRPRAPSGSDVPSGATTSTLGAPSAARAHPIAPPTASGHPLPTSQVVDDAPAHAVGREAPSTTFTHVAVASNDEVYAIGTGKRDGVARGIVVHSYDGGRTWEHRAAIGAFGGKLLLPPAYPADPRIFLTTSNGLSVSPDGGNTFFPASAMAGWAAMSPQFSKGHPVFLTGNAPGWFVDISQGLTRPAGLALPASTWPANFAFGPRYSEDGTVYVGASTFLRNGWEAAAMPPVVFVCRPSGCVEAARGGGHDGAAPEFSVDHRDGIVWAFTRNWLWRSSDGSTFESIPLQQWTREIVPTPRAVLAVAGATYLSLECNYFRCGGIFRTGDNGSTWEKVGGDTFPHGVSSMAALSDGTLLVVQHAAIGGIYRSTDRGATWQQVA